MCGEFKSSTKLQWETTGLLGVIEAEWSRYFHFTFPLANGLAVRANPGLETSDIKCTKAIRKFVWERNWA
jgi:hypothetical protein